MSWLYSQALVAEYLAENSLDGEQSAPLNGNHTPLAFLPPDKMTAFSRLSRSGITFAPLTDDRGEDVLTWFLAAFPARTSAAPERALESTESDLECGWKWHGSFAKWHPATSSWKTRQCSLLEGLDEFSETWPKWGSMQDGECLELATLERPTSGTEFGFLLPTPRCHDAKKMSISEMSRKSPCLAAMVMYPTPMASEARQGYQNRHNGKKGSQESLTTMIQGGPANQVGGSLNPTWVEWLMGWHLEWTDLKPLETDKFQQWLHSHSNF
jgi:hypothetical protein